MADSDIESNHEITVRPAKGWYQLRLGEVWEFRELMIFFVWRDLAVKYKQTFLGILWAIIQPLLTMVVFSVIFGKLAKLDSEGFPYEIFSYIGILPWQLFSSGVNNAAASVIGATNTISKTYFPRLILPIADVLGGVVDFSIAFVILLLMMLFWKISFTWRLIAIPFLLVYTIITALATGIWLSALNVKYRDLKFMTNFLLQFWQYATPVAYSSKLIPAEWLWLYRLNPMSLVIDGFRWALLGANIIVDASAYLSIGVVALLLISGVTYFQNLERTFVDIV